MDVVTPFQFSLVYNAFSFTLAAMAAATAFFWLSRTQVSPAYRTAVVISGLVTAIAAYHYYRIFESWNASYTLEAGIVSATGFAFNDAYRYVDWLLTVPLLLIELVLVIFNSTLGRELVRDSRVRSCKLTVATRVQLTLLPQVQKSPVGNALRKRARSICCRAYSNARP